MNTETETPNGEQTNNTPVPGGDATSTTTPQATDTATDAGGAEGQGDGGKPPATAGEPGAPAGDGTQETPKPEGTGEQQQTGTADEIVYTDFQMPVEGVVLEGERREVVHSLFKKARLTQEQAQMMVEFAATEEAGKAAAIAEAIQSAIDTQREEWGRQSVERFGDRYQEEMSYARTAVNALKDPELEKAFVELGWGNHPALVKAFATMGRVMRDSPMDGIGQGGAAQSDVPLQNRMYPNMKT
jgi:uncharacterized protein YukE